MYFNWWNENNPLYKDIEFSRTKLSEFERKLTKGTEEYVKHSDCKIIEDEVEKECISGYTSEDPLEQSHIIHDTTINPIQIKDEINVQHFDSVMCNKNEHERFDDSVVKRYAQIIIQYETVKKKCFQTISQNTLKKNMKLTTFLKMVMNTLTQKLKTLKTCNQIIIFLTGWGRKLRGQLKKRVLKQKNEFQT